MNYEMTLAQLIEVLEAHDQSIVVNGFCNPHSYRGYYEELAFEPAECVTVASMLRCARESVGKTFSGYKGGEYVMHEQVGVWLAHYGCTGQIINANYLFRIFGDGKMQSEIAAKDAEIARLRDVLSVIAYPLNIGKVYHMDAVTQARAALAQVAESPE